MLVINEKAESKTKKLGFCHLGEGRKPLQTLKPLWSETEPAAATAKEVPSCPFKSSSSCFFFPPILVFEFFYSYFFNMIMKNNV